ncbi:type II secretion system F family protein [Chitinimonas lacunae]|uniref:Type II secretion system F family protein n=1 Tax=Chitinimonas lacunae TaxID=1963018 RepID=A0ABV8MTY1_9NEIS
MPSFAYRARDPGGAPIDGTIEAVDLDGAANQLRERGLTPIRLEPVKEGLGLKLSGLHFGPRVRPEDLMLFSRQMNTLMKSGVPILRALASLQESAANPAFGEVIGRLRQSLDSGREMSIAMRDSGEFTNFYISMVRVGEATGMLDQVFMRLFVHLEFEKRMKAQIKSALRYPSFVVIAMAVAISVINVMVIPVFAGIFKGFKTELPLMTRIMIGFSDFTVNYWPWLLGLIAAAVLAVRAWLGTEAGRLRWDRWKLSLPIVGPIVSQATLARFSRSFALTLRSGVPITQAMQVVAEVVDNAHVSLKVREMELGVERGESLLRNAVTAGIFTPVVLQMIAVGEETGRIDELLEEIADMYEQEVAYAVEGLSAKIEPILIVVLAAIVLALALGVFLPMWDLGKVALKRG